MGRYKVQKDKRGSFIKMGYIFDKSQIFNHSGPFCWGVDIKLSTMVFVSLLNKIAFYFWPYYPKFDLNLIWIFMGTNWYTLARQSRNY